MSDAALPPGVSELFGAEPVFSDDHEGRSGGVVQVNGTYWMKRGSVARAEHERLAWLAAQGVAVPEVVLFEADTLVLADAGVPSLAAANAPGKAMGVALRRLHDLPITLCPFDGRLDVMLAQAAVQVRDGLVDAEDFDDDNLGRTPEHVLEQLRAERPGAEDLVVAHGDYTPSNVLEGGLLIDVGRLGVADRYRDIALAVRDLEDDFGPDEVRAFLAAYGLSEADPARLRYYRLLDELF
ncbi:aminoglycoside 3'-phosphotransferase [Nocardia sp. 2]|uniref:Aminoglycoside 3'-phosphotransferase n=2 Tax=Nocardia acididurans TaxID=2802282 RepID=A0ABS1MDY7_9NOCA|nr:aminoglycoside 3'-phosphotransferase [Nocardia acididurans]